AAESATFAHTPCAISWSCFTVALHAPNAAFAVFLQALVAALLGVATTWAKTATTTIGVMRMERSSSVRVSSCARAAANDEPSNASQRLAGTAWRRLVRAVRAPEARAWSAGFTQESAGS